MRGRGSTYGTFTAEDKDFLNYHRWPELVRKIQVNISDINTNQGIIQGAYQQAVRQLTNNLAIAEKHLRLMKQYNLFSRWKLWQHEPQSREDQIAQWKRI